MTARDRLRAEPCGPCVIVLRSDVRHALRASWATLRCGVLTAETARGLRSYPMAEIAVVKWETTAEERAA